MKRITAKEFYAMLEKNPSVFEHWSTPLEVTEYVDCEHSKITHLSKHLTFSGKNDASDYADFSNCPNLQIATGTFHGFVWFANSGIQKIENLNIKNCDKDGWASCFENCPNLQIATGTYPGFVSFFSSGVHSIQNLHIEKPNASRNFADFSQCSNLQNLEGWDLSKQILIEPEKLAAEKARRIALQKFHIQNKPKELPFL
jgi:hypothetical protein